MSATQERPSCCPPDMHPSVSAADAGATKDLIGQYTLLPGNIRCYVVTPDKEIKGVVIVFHDIFGFNSGRTHHMADEISERGDYLVLAPDFFGESAVTDPKEFLSFKFFSKGSAIMTRGRRDFGLVEEMLNNSIIPYIRERTDAKIGAVGFCWGGWAVVRTAGLANRILSCGVGAHPSVHTQVLQKTGPTMDEMFHAVNAPLLFCPGWNDPSSLREDGYYTNILKAGGGKGSKVVLFSRQMHGFANRADIRVTQNKEDVDKFMNVMMEFFAQHLQSDQSKANL